MLSLLRDKKDGRALMPFAFLLSLFFLISCGSSREFQNNQYENIDGAWYLVNESDEKFAIIENTVTLKYEEAVDEMTIKNFEQEFGLTFVRKSSAGWYDYEVVPEGNIFRKCNAMMKSGKVSKIEIPTGGVYTE